MHVWLSRTARMFACAALVNAVVLGCADESPLQSARSACSLSSECTSPLVCAFQKCHVQCGSSKDCDNGKGRCVQSEKPYYVCQFDDEKGCLLNSDCSGSQLCARDGQCHDACAADRDCLQDQTCSEGACADKLELVQGRLPTKLAGDASTGVPCIHSTDCPGDLVCKSKTCTEECVADKDCPVAWACQPVREGGGRRCFPPHLQADGGAL